jgi:hypothetical protein
MKLIKFISATIVLHFIALSVIAESLNGQIMVYVPKAEVMNAGDHAEHSLLLVELKGLATLDNGEVGTITGAEVAEHASEQHTFYGYITIKFSDESTVSFRFEGEEDAKSGAYQGTLAYMNGSGRYAGIKGKGKIKGQNYEEINGSHATFTSSYKIKK